MGNTSSSVTDGVKSQAEASSRALYKLVNLGGGGELIDLMKTAIRRKNFDEVDAKILSEVPKFVYANGAGKVVPLSEVIAQRQKERGNVVVVGSNKLLTDDTDDFAAKKLGMPVPGTEQLKEVCWDLKERGATILHVCFLVGTFVACELGKRLLHHFPKLIVDFYISDEYYGENALHQAIVNEDPATVKFLLDHGVNVHQRCCGNFFTPTDQQANRQDSPYHEWVNLSVATNYKSHTYWGEYALTFAACLNQEDCFRLLRAKKANPNCQDANGNTVVHIMVIRENKRMFDLAHSLGADIHIKNRQNLVPLTLAAKLAKPEMFFHVLDVEREINWTYGQVTCATYPLEYIDSIAPDTGDINRDSALALVVYGDSGDHLELLDGLLVDLLKHKWETFARRRLYRQFGLFIAYFLVYSTAWYLRPTYLETRIIDGTYGDPTNNTFNGTMAVLHEDCYLLNHDSVSDQFRLFFELLTVAGASMYLISTAIDMFYHVGYKLYLESLYGFPARIIFLLSCAMVWLMIPLRAACTYDAENVVGIVATVLTSFHFLFFARGFKLVGAFVLMIYKMIVGDLFRFFIIYLIFVMGFCQAFYIIFLGFQRDNPDRKLQDNLCRNFQESFYQMFMVSVGEANNFYAALNDCELATLGKILFVVYMLLVAVLLINLLIAMMGDTYEKIAEAKKEYLRQWAAIILNMEQSLKREERIDAQIKYSRPLPGGSVKRGLVVHIRHSEEEAENIRTEREANQRAFQEQKVADLRKKMQKDTTNLIRTSSPVRAAAELFKTSRSP